MMKRSISALLLICIILLSACSSQKSEAVETSLPEADEGYVWITDCAGRQVQIPIQPERIAALDSFSAEAMVMLVSGDRMVAAPNGVKSDALLQMIYPELSDVSVPMSGGTINAEELASLNPDLVFLKASIYAAEGETEKLDKLNIPYLVVDYGTMQEQMDALSMIGEALGGSAENTATSINAYYQEVVDLAASIKETIPEDERYGVYHSINEFTRTDGYDSLGYDWIECVGAINVSAGVSTLSEGTDYYCSAEQIFSLDPDIIICNEASTVDYLYSEGKWSGLRAVRDEQVYNIPVAATRWGQRGSLETFFAILWLGTTIYPEYYGEVDLKAEVVSFYKTYYDITLDDETYDLILSGEGIRTQSAGNSGG